MAGKQSSSTDSWKKKKTYQLIAPKEFNEVQVGSTVAEKTDTLIGRIIQVNLGNLTREAKKSHIQLILQVSRVEGLNALTNLKGFDVNPFYLRRIVRRRVSKIETSQLVQLKDGIKTRIKAVSVTMRKAHKKQETALRKIMVDEINALAKQKNFNELVNEFLFGSFTMKLFGKAKKVVPIKRVEIIKAMQLKEKIVKAA